MKTILDKLNQILNEAEPDKLRSALCGFLNDLREPVTVQEYAKAIGQSPRTVRDKIKAGKITASLVPNPGRGWSEVYMIPTNQMYPNYVEKT